MIFVRVKSSLKEFFKCISRRIWSILHEKCETCVIVLRQNQGLDCVLLPLWVLHNQVHQKILTLRDILLLLIPNSAEDKRVHVELSEEGRHVWAHAKRVDLPANSRLDPELGEDVVQSCGHLVNATLEVCHCLVVLHPAATCDFNLAGFDQVTKTVTDCVVLLGHPLVQVVCVCPCESTVFVGFKGKEKFIKNRSDSCSIIFINCEQPPSIRMWMRNNMQCIFIANHTKEK